MKQVIEFEFGKDLERTDRAIKNKVLLISNKNKGLYVVYSASLRWLTIEISKRKPSAANALTEHTYRHHGGFFKDGNIIKPSDGFIKKYNFIPSV